MERVKAFLYLNDIQANVLRMRWRKHPTEAKRGQETISQLC